MKINFCYSLLISLTLFSTSVMAEVISSRTEKIEVIVNQKTLNCHMISQSSHGGSFKMPSSFFKTDKIKKTIFKHGMLMGGFSTYTGSSCDGINGLLERIKGKEKYHAKLSIKVRKMTAINWDGRVTVDLDEDVEISIPTLDLRFETSGFRRFKSQAEFDDFMAKNPPSRK